MKQRYEPNVVFRSGTTIFVVNDATRQSNRWSATVQAGVDDNGSLISQAECEAWAREMASAPLLLKALQAMRKAFDISEIASPFEDQLKAHALAQAAIHESGVREDR